MKFIAMNRFKIVPERVEGFENIWKNRKTHLEKVPGCYFFVGSSPQGKKTLSVPHHCSHFDIDEKALLIGASVYIQLIKDLLT